MICFEFLQRPENVLAGYLAWPDYRGQQAPNAIKITHHKTGAVVWHPLEETTERRHGQILRRRRSRARAFAAAWHRDDFESSGTGRREAIRPP